MPGQEQPSKFIMPVETADAAKQFEIEAMRLIAKNLEKLGDKFDKQAETLIDIQTRVVAIESNRLESEVAELKAKLEAALRSIADLEGDRNRRDGAMGVAKWLIANWTSLVGMLLAAVIAAKVYLGGK